MKQKDADSKVMSPLSMPPSHSNHTSQLPFSIERAFSVGVQGEKLDEVQRLKAHMHEQEAKWKQAYEKITKELETLKIRGAEAVVAAQWRTRYEVCAKEREELNRKLQLYSQLASEIAHSDKSLEELYIELAESSKVRIILYFSLFRYLLSICETNSIAFVVSGFASSPSSSAATLPHPASRQLPVR
ncbi:hypothetical protein EON65_09570 [archaeon]|nr:MAG: hypothetical protein EON65_09570 [archaeon]